MPSKGQTDCECKSCEWGEYHDCATPVRATLAEARDALAFAASCIKSGEPWSSTCERVIGKALKTHPEDNSDAE